MRNSLLIIALLCLTHTLSAQYVYTIKADSVKLTYCDSSELIIENHTQSVPGFLFNTGRGRTIFRRGVMKINDSFYLIGADTLKLPSNSWVQGGNRFGTTGVLGTLDNNHLDFYTNNVRRARIDSIGHFSLDVTASQPATNLFSLTNSNGNFKWVSLSGDYNYASFTMTPNNPAFDPVFQIKASYNSSIETFAYSDLSVKAYAGLDLYGGYGSGATKGIRFFPGYSGFAGGFSLAGNLILGDSVDNGNKLQVHGTGSWVGPINTGSRIIVGDTGINNVLGIRAYGDTSNAQNNHYAALGVNLPEPYSMYNTAKQGGGVYFDDRNGVAPIRFMVRPAGASYIAAPAGVITSNGNFLLGTTSENGNRLQVQGSAYINGTFVQANPNTASFGNGLYFDILSLGGISTSRILGPGEIVYQSNNTGDQHLFSNAVGTAFTGTLVTIDPGYYPFLPDAQLALKVLGRTNNLGLAVNMLGNVGVGTLTPSAQLHTTGTVRFAGLTSDTTKTRVLVSDASGNLYYRDASTLASNDLLPSSLANRDSLRSSLAVNGTISARRLTLSQTGWPDYVFDSSYRLLPMEQLEKYIRMNNHLPGMPSASDVEKQGVDIGDHQAALLKKVEELTLYSIEEHKKQETQAEELKALRQEVMELKQLLLKRAEK